MAKQPNSPSGSRTSRSPQVGVQSVSRALDLLEVFPAHGPELGLTTIASQLNLNKATAHRLLTTLAARGYVQRSPSGHRYRLGSRVLDLGAYYESQLDVRRIALPFMLEMVEHTGDAAFLCIREGDEAVCVERVEGEHEVKIFALRVGGRQPLHCGAAPRALLAGLDDAELQAYAARTGLPAFTPNTLSTLEELRADARRTREQGYALSDEDVTLGIAAIGAPIRDHSGQIIASISLSGLVTRFGPERIAGLTEIVMSSAARFSHQMGFREGK